MKKTITAAIMIFLIGYSSYSQWVQQTSGTTNFLQTIQGFGTNLIYAAGFSGTFLRTTNGGINWIVTTIPSAANINEIDFVPTGNASTGWAASNGVYKTTNGGVNWVQQFSSTSNIDVSFQDINTGYALSSSGVIRKTTNSGVNWTQHSFTNLSLGGKDISIGNVLYILAAENITDSSYIFKSTNQGVNWSQVSSMPEEVSTIEFLNDNTGLLCGNNGLIKKTTNGGINWVNINSGTSADLSDLVYQTNQLVYISGTDVVLKSTNGGNNWLVQSMPGNFVHRSISFLTDTVGFTCGSGGAIFKTTNGGGNFTGIIQITGTIPGKFSLSQNYPNPFNPTTTISFAIPGQSHVQLKVYDMLGKEAAMIVNENLPAGSYSAGFDAASLPSGTYFYRITAGEFYEVKKMILIK